jgi:SsrA-binding protein
MKTYATNKRAKFDYDILQTFEAGLVLAGHEVKSIKTGHVSLKGAFVVLKQQKGKELPELHLVNCHISPYKHAGALPSYDPDRSRKLLIKRSEIKRLIGKTREQGLTLVPISLYNKRNLIKLSFGLGRGKRKIDKRETIKKRELDRQQRRLTKLRG